MATRPELAPDTGAAADDWADAVNSITARERQRMTAKSVVSNDIEIQRANAARRQSTKRCIAAIKSTALVCGFQRCASCTLAR